MVKIFRHVLLRESYDKWMTKDEGWGSYYQGFMLPQGEGCGADA